MIKINLLNSVTERQGSAVVSVEKRVSSPMTRILMMGIAVFVLTATVIGLDFIMSSRAKAQAETALAEQKKKEKELAAVLKEQKELEAKIQNIDLRIEAIKKLRNSQAGPSAVLEAIRERITMTPDIFLDSVDQKGDQLTIKGTSPSESEITQFGRSLEFSSGLFSNLGIETQRKEIQLAKAEGQEEAPKKEYIEFTIRTAYTPEKANSGGDVTTAQNNSSEPPEGNPTDSNSEPENPNPPKVAQNQDN